MKIRGIERLRRTARQLTSRFLPRAIILLYHRVTELPLDPQLLCVTPQHFAEHLDVIRGFGRTVQVKALGRGLQSGCRNGRIISITFDDGYADNLYNAKPLLERYDACATVFATSGYLGSKREFWYDQLERIFLHAGSLPAMLRLEVNGRCYEWELGPATEYGKGAYGNFRDWNVSRKDFPTSRHRVYRSAVELLQPLPDSERQQIVDELANWAGLDNNHRSTHRTLSPEELMRLAGGGIVEIGSHTVTHPVLSTLPVGEQRNEISRSKSCLEKILERPVTSFAYPFGGRSHYTAQTVAAVRSVGFEWACSNFAGIVDRDTDRWQLPRFLVRDWDGDEFARYLDGWIHA